MNVSLTPQMVKFVEEQVSTGDYQSASEVVRSGLRLLQEKKRERQVKLEALRREIAIGIAQADRGEVAPLDVEEIKAEGRRRLAEQGIPEQLETARG